MALTDLKASAVALANKTITVKYWVLAAAGVVLLVVGHVL